MRRDHGQRRGQEAVLEAQQQQGPGQVGVTGRAGSGSGVRGQVAVLSCWTAGGVGVWGGEPGHRGNWGDVRGSGDGIGSGDVGSGR